MLRMPYGKSGQRDEEQKSKDYAFVYMGCFISGLSKTQTAKARPEQCSLSLHPWVLLYDGKAQLFAS